VLAVPHPDRPPRRRAGGARAKGALDGVRVVRGLDGKGAPRSAFFIAESDSTQPTLADLSRRVVHRRHRKARKPTLSRGSHEAGRVLSRGQRGHLSMLFHPRSASTLIVSQRRRSQQGGAAFTLAPPAWPYGWRSIVTRSIKNRGRREF